VRIATSRPGSAGFTLIELLVGLAIVAAVFALILPNLPRIVPGGLVDAATAEAAATLRSARTAAIRDNRTVSASIEGGRLAVEFQPDGSSTGGVLDLAAAGHKRRVVVDALTGRVSVERP
jgi:prepilin-type N-terminal cleavage/methylation domain-containing protein